MQHSPGWEYYGWSDPGPTGSYQSAVGQQAGKTGGRKSPGKTA